MAKPHTKLLWLSITRWSCAHCFGLMFSVAPTIAEVEADTNSFLAPSNGVLSHLSPETLESMIEDGWIDPLALQDDNYDPVSIYSDYQSYDTRTLMDLAEAGDAKAQLFASMSSEISLEEREEYAIDAASQGLTSGLARLGATLIFFPSSLESEIDNHSLIRTGLSYYLAAVELGDVSGEDPVLLDSILRQFSDTNIKDVEAAAQEIVIAVKSRM